MEATVKLDESQVNDQINTKLDNMLKMYKEAILNDNPFIIGKANLAKYLHRGHDVVQRLVLTGKIKSHDVDGKDYFLKSEVIKFVEAN